MTNLLALSAGTELVGDFKIKKVLGAGGFGITYLAEELALARQVTIKEYFPSDFAARDKGKDAKARSRECAADYKWGLERFIEEAQTLARFDHPNIVRVYRYFRANNTGYMVLQFEEGKSLKGWLKGLGRAPRQAELDELLVPLLDALDLIHKRDFLHRDIAPDNIMVRKDKSPVLIDFGSARGEIVSHSRTVSALVKPGYSPYEQYASTSRQQGPWTDIYALGATFYQAITGKRPPDAPSRMVKDEYVPARLAAIGNYRAGFLSAIDKALRLEIGERPQSIGDWRAELIEGVGAPMAPAARSGRVKLGAMLGLGRGQAPPVAAAASDGAVAAVVKPQDGVAVSIGEALPEVMPVNKKATRKAGEAAAAAPVAPAAAVDNDLGPRDLGPGDLVPGRFGLGYGPAPEANRSPTGVAAPFAGSAAGALNGAAKAPDLPLPPAPEMAPKRRGGREVPKSEMTLAVPVPVERRHPVKARKRWFFLRQPWRGLIAKFAIGIAVASLLVAYQNQLPQTAVTKSVPRELVSKTAAKAEPAAATLEPSSVLGTHIGPVKALGAVAANGRVVSLGADGLLKVWDPAAGVVVRTIALMDGAATALSVDDGFALSAHSDGTLALWELKLGRRVGAYKSPGAVAVALLDRSGKFVSGASDGRVALWERQATSGPVSMTEAHGAAVTALVRVDGRDAVVSAGADKVLKMLTAGALQPVRSYRGHKAEVSHVDSVAGGTMLASADGEGQIRLWSTASSRLIRSIKAHSGAVTALRVGPRSEMIVSAGVDGLVKVWDGRRGKLVMNAKAPGGNVRGAVFIEDGRRLITASDDGRLRLWDLRSIQIARD